MGKMFFACQRLFQEVTIWQERIIFHFGQLLSSDMTDMTAQILLLLGFPISSFQEQLEDGADSVLLYKFP